MSAEIYAVYDALRAGYPVHWNETARAWMLFRYRDVAGVLSDSSFSSGERLREMRREFSFVLSEARVERALGIFARQLETLDPPMHTRVRQAFSPCFRDIVAGLRPAVSAQVEELCCALDFRFPLDLVSMLARPLPLLVVLEALGVRREARPGFGDDVAAFLRHLSDPRVDEEGALGRIRREIRAAEGGILAALAHRENMLGQDDVLSNAILIVSAGHRTTANLIGSVLFSLLNNQPELELLVTRPELIPDAVEEVLRLESPIQSLQRTTTKKVTIGGIEIKEGQSLTLMLGAANRDPEEFASPEKFNLGRSPNRHLAFGLGAHLCLGAALARMQAAIVVKHLAHHLRGVRIQSAVWHDHPESRGLARLIVDR